MISLDYEVLKYDKQAPGVKTSFPFFSWQCLSLCFETRTVDLVIKDPDQMDRLIKYLVQALDAVDGRANTGSFFTEAAVINEIQRQERRLNKKRLKARAKILEEGDLASDEEFSPSLNLECLKEEEKQEIRQKKQKEIYRQAMFKYTLMRVRQKISYHAFQQRMTVNELFLTAI